MQDKGALNRDNYFYHDWMHMINKDLRNNLQTTLHKLIGLHGPRFLWVANFQNKSNKHVIGFFKQFFKCDKFHRY